MKKITIGIITITDPAICSPCSVVCPARLATATAMYIDSSVEIISGHRKLFHDPVKLRIPSVARPVCEREHCSQTTPCPVYPGSLHSSLGVRNCLMKKTRRRLLPGSMRPE